MKVKDIPYFAEVEKYVKAATKIARLKVDRENLDYTLSRAASSAEQAGVSPVELVGLAVAGQRKTKRDGHLLGNALKRIFVRMTTPYVLNELKRIGLVTEVTENGDVLRLLEDLANIYEELMPTHAFVLVESIGGTFENNVLQAILHDLQSKRSVYKKVKKELEKQDNGK